MSESQTLQEAALKRNKNLLGGIATSAISRGLGFIAPLIMIPLALSTLGVTVYGFWSAAVALTAMVMFSDLGLGNGLMTRLGVCYADNDEKRARELIASAFVMTALAGVVFSLMAAVSIYSFDAASWIDTKGQVPRSDANQILLVVFLAFFINIPLSLATRIQYAYQRVSYSNFWSAGGSLAVLLAFAVASHLGLGAVGVIAVSAFALPAVSGLNLVTYLRLIEPELWPRPCKVTWDVVKDLFGLGGTFLIISVLTTLAMYADTLLVTRVLGLEQAASYSIAWRILSAIGIMITLLNLPLWPANSEAIARGDTRWVARTARKMTLVSGLGAVLVATAVLLLRDTLITRWLGESEAVPSHTLLAAIAGWMIVLSIFSPWLMVQNGASVLRPQIVGLIAFLVLGLPLKIVALQQVGAWGAPAVGTCVYVLCMAPACAIGTRRALRP